MKKNKISSSGLSDIFNILYQLIVFLSIISVGYFVFTADFKFKMPKKLSSDEIINQVQVCENAGLEARLFSNLNLIKIECYSKGE